MVRQYAINNIKPNKMKRVICIIGIVLLLFNTLIGIIFSSYPQYNYLMTDLSIILSTALICLSVSSRLDDGYKIGLTWIFSFTGFARVICCIAMPQNSENNVFLMIVCGILLVEILCLAIPILLTLK